MDLRYARRVCAVLWLLVLGGAVASVIAHEPSLGAFVFICAFVMFFVTAGVARATAEEVLVRPVLYRVACSALLATALWGGVLALVPHASDPSRVFGVYFLFVAILAYRALVARGPRRALIGVVIAMLSWLPFIAVTMIGCKRPMLAWTPHWTEIASGMTLRVLVLMLGLVAAVTLLAFERQDLPTARVR